MVQGQQYERTVTPRGESILAVASPVVLAAAALALGLYLPPGIDGVLKGAASLLGGGN
jgi:hypothetical protein